MTTKSALATLSDALAKAARQYDVIVAFPSR